MSLVVLFCLVSLLNFILSFSGSLESCKKRLKHYYRNEAMSKVFRQPITYFYDVICVVDFEATCQREAPINTIQEIIEFPAFIIDVRQRQIVSS